MSRYNSVWHKGRCIDNHRLIAEKALGKSIPNGVEVHHYGDDKNDFSIVLCNNSCYHRLLHYRTTALKECGNANFKRCKYCREWDDPENLKYYRDDYWTHSDCVNRYYRERRAKLKLKRQRL